MTKVENVMLLEDAFEVSVANFYGYDEATGIEYYSGSLESHELTQSGDTEKIKAGQSNEVLGVINKDKEVVLKITDVKSRGDLESAKFGGKLTTVGTSNVDALHMPRNYEIVSNLTKLEVTLTHEPKAGEVVMVYNNKTKKLIDPTKAVRVGTKIMITEAGLVAGDTVYVTGFKRKASATDKFADITTDSSAPTLFVVIEVPLFDGDMNVICRKQYHFPKAKLSTAVTKSGKSERSKATDETTLEIVKDGTVDYLGRIVFVYPDVV